MPLITGRLLGSSSSLQRLLDAGRVVGVNLPELLQRPLLNKFGRVLQLGDDVVVEGVPLRRRVAEVEVADLGVVVLVVGDEAVHVGGLDVGAQLVELLRIVVHGRVEGAGVVVGHRPLVVPGHHGAVAEGRRQDGHQRLVDGDQVKVGADAVAGGVGVGEEARLEDLVRGELETGHAVGWAESELLYLGKVVVRIAV